MIPQEKRGAVARGLREAFGVSEFDDVSRMMGGQTTSLVFRIIVRGTPYLLKIILRSDDPTRHYTSMRAAADAGLAPRVWYANVEDKISITDFVTAEHLPMPEALVRLPAVLRVLHGLPPFSRAPYNTTCTFLLNPGPALDGYLKQFQAANLLPHAAGEELLTRYAELVAAYRVDEADLVSSHNDLFKPDNILFDGQRDWLVDWEAAFLNDRYADLAVVANQVVTNDEEEMVYLREYFGAAPDEYQWARFHLMQQMAHLFYAMAFLLMGSREGPVDWSGAVPGFREYQRRAWAGEVDLSDKVVMRFAGRVHWGRLLENVRQRRYREAIGIMKRRGGGVMLNDAPKGAEIIAQKQGDRS